MKSLIFVVDTQPESREFMRKCLEAADYLVRAFAESEADLQVGLGRPSLIIAALDLQADSDFRWRHVQDSLFAGVPWIGVLSDSSGEGRLMVLDAGADDCIVEPFSPRELIAHVHAVLRRGTLHDRRDFAHTADIMIDSWAMKLLVRGAEIPTTALEFRLLEYLARHRGQVFTRDFLLDAVWGDMRFISPRSVDACIRRVREKIEPDVNNPTYLKTVRGIGYRFDGVAVWPGSKINCNCAACAPSSVRGAATRPPRLRRREVAS
jgi:two-component system phosphate regulon response regulator PhoB